MINSTLAMRDKLRPPKGLSRAEETIMRISRKVKPKILKELGPRAAQILQAICVGEQEPLLFFDDTYQVLAYNIKSKEIVGNLPYSSFQVKCMLCSESKLFVGLNTGEIIMYDALTLELLGKADTNRQAIPITIASQSTGTLLIGM